MCRYQECNTKLTHCSHCYECLNLHAAAVAGDGELAVRGQPLRPPAAPEEGEGSVENCEILL